MRAQPSPPSQDEFEAKNKSKAPAGKRYFSHNSLPDMVAAYPCKPVRVAGRALGAGFVCAHKGRFPMHV